MSEVHIIADLKSVKVDGDPAAISITLVCALTENNQDDVLALATMKRTRAPIVVHLTCSQPELMESPRGAAKKRGK